MAIASNLGFPRIGSRRELKRAVEGFWKGNVAEDELQSTARAIRRRHWQLQHDAGIQHIPSNDFSLYDHVLDTIAMLGAVPERFGWTGETVDTATYFAMARGAKQAAPLEMTKWFDTNYHFLVPEIEPGIRFRLASTKPLDEFSEALSLGIHTRPVLLGPVTFLLLGKSRADWFASLSVLDRVLPIYEDMIRRLVAAGAQWLQIDEPVLATDLSDQAQAALTLAYARLSTAAGQAKICLASYFGDLRDNLQPALQLPVTALHLDLVRAPGQLDQALSLLPRDRMLSLGVVDGRNVWRADLERALGLVEKAVAALGPDRLLVAPSCSLLHSPIDLDDETGLDDELKSWMAFARQKLDEIAAITRAANEDRQAIAQALGASQQTVQSRRDSARIHNPHVRERLQGISETMLSRAHPFADRQKAQRTHLALPLLPTTTIGSFPQTEEVRKARASRKSGDWSSQQYEAFLKDEIRRTVCFQEQIDLDVLVHGEAERNDMVEYFGEQLQGFAFTQNGWVQSYGTRCVKPPVIFGDVSRPTPMTVAWTQYAQSLTQRPMKGMLTGPITILKWSFVRDDQPWRDTAFQIALAIRDEVVDLETAGIRVIQIDEPAIREGLPLHRDQWADYLQWAVDAFRLAASGVRDETQIHTHMCYSEFNEIIESIAAMDADVISIEASRSDMELLDAFARFKYPNEIGPGVYDIHSPRVPGVDEMVARLRKAMERIPAESLWVNPDCGLKTRGWPEVEASLKNMVAAAKLLRHRSPA